MSAGGSYKRVLHNPGTMANTLPSTQELKGFDHCCGIHGAMRERRGIKHGTSAARRRVDKLILAQELQEMETDPS